MECAWSWAWYILFILDILHILSIILTLQNDLYTYISFYSNSKFNYWLKLLQGTIFLKRIYFTTQLWKYLSNLQAKCYDFYTLFTKTYFMFKMKQFSKVYWVKVSDHETTFHYIYPFYFITFFTPLFHIAACIQFLNLKITS